MERGPVEARRLGAAVGLLLGTAVGDAVGLPREGLSGRRGRRRFGVPPLVPGLVLGRGMCSDDTEHACMTAQALLASGGDPDRFARSLAWRLRGWLLGLPAGVGSATLRAVLKLWVGFPPGRSGVRSAGNGPAMRAPVIGLYADDPGRRRALVRASTRLTHTDPRAEQGALAVAIAAAVGQARGPGVTLADFLAAAGDDLTDPELTAAVGAMRPPLAAGASVAEYAATLGLTTGVSGYVNHTVPVALYAWLRHPADLRAAVESVVMLGGDTDSVGAVAGALVGATAGAAAVPAEWVSRLWEWPRSPRWLRRLGEALATGGGPVPLFWPGLIVRNAAFAAVVIGHGVRRLLPPY